MTHKLEILRIGGRYTQSQVLNWQQEPEYLVCNDLETGQLFLAKRGLGTWCEVDLHMLARKLNTQQGAAQREGWKPIETAPKDGAWVLTTNVRPPIRSSSRANISARARDGHWYNIQDQSPREADDQPTHWMPLPVAPAPEGAQEGEKR